MIAQAEDSQVDSVTKRGVQESMDRRRQAFGQLRPVCVALSQKAMGLGSDQKELVDVLQKLLSMLNSLKAQKKNCVIDGALADYVFFPLSHVLQSVKESSDLVVEKSLQCLLILLDTAWSISIAAPLAKQLLMFQTFTTIFLYVSSEQPKQQRRPSEETTLAVLKCLTSLLHVLGSEDDVREELCRTGTIPLLVQNIPPMLGWLKPEHPPAVKCAAADALRAFVDLHLDPDVLASVLPGIISNINKVLILSGKNRTPEHASIKLLETLASCLDQCFGDEPSTGAEDPPGEEIAGLRKVCRDKAWRQESGKQICIVLKNATQLRKRHSAGVNTAIWNLSYLVVTLEGDAFSPAIGTLIEWMVFQFSQGPSALPPGQSSRFLALVKNSKDLQASLESWLRGILLRLDRIMQGANDDLKAEGVTMIAAVYELSTRSMDGQQLQRLSGTILEALTSALIGASGTPSGGIRPTVAVVEAMPQVTMELQSAASQQLESPLGLVLRSQSQSAGLEAVIQRLLRSLTKSTASPVFLTASQADNSEYDSPTTTIPWALALQSIDPAQLQSPPLDPTTSNSLEALYSHSLTLLLNQPLTVPLGPQTTALILHTISLQASLLGSSFRPELLDVLYPIIALSASPIESTRQRAYQCLLALTRHCGYQDLASLVVENSDYLVNALSMKFYTFELTPQAPAIARVMLRLCGKRILPFMDDMVGAIFTAIDNFHGYSKLCIDLFGVLHALVESAGTPENSTPQLTAAAAAADSTAPPSNTTTAPALPPRVLALIHLITLSTQNHLTQPSPLLRQTLCRTITLASPLLSPDEDQFLPLINAIWPMLHLRLFDPEAYVVVAASEAVVALLRGSDGFMSSRFRTGWEGVEELVRTVGGKGRRRDAGGAKALAASGIVLDVNRMGSEGSDSRNRVLRALAGMMTEVVRSCRVEDAMVDQVASAFPPHVADGAGLTEAIQKQRELRARQGDGEEDGEIPDSEVLGGMAAAVG